MVPVKVTVKYKKCSSSNPTFDLAFYWR